MKLIKIISVIILLCAKLPATAQSKTDRWVKTASRKLKATIYLDSINEDYTFFAQSKRSKLWGYGQYTEKKALLYIPITYQELMPIQSDVFMAKYQNSYGLIKSNFTENNAILVPFLFSSFLYDDQCKVMQTVKMRNSQGKWGMFNIRNGMLMARHFGSEHPKTFQMYIYNQTTQSTSNKKNYGIAYLIKTAPLTS